MGKYLDRKQAIEQKLKDELANAAAALAASIDAAAVYTEKERHRVMHEAVDRYNARTAGPRKTAVAQESRLFEELGQAVEAAIAAPPSAEALRYLDALALNPSVTAHDIEAAASFVRGNAAAEASLAGIAEKNGLAAILEFGPAPSIREIQDGLETFRASREERIMKVGEVGANFKADEWGLEMFMPGASHKAFDRAEAIVEQYGAK